MDAMHWYRLFLFFFVVWGPLKGEEKQGFLETETTLSLENKDVEKEPSLDTWKNQNGMKGSTQSYEMAFIKTITILIGLIALIFLTIWMFKKISHGRLQTFNSMKSIKILEKRPLSPKSILYLIEFKGKIVLIAESQINIKSLTSFDLMNSDKDL